MKRDCTICVAKTKALISCAVTAQLICAFVFAYAKSRISHEAAYMCNASHFYLSGHKIFSTCDNPSTKNCDSVSPQVSSEGDHAAFPNKTTAAYQRFNF